MSHPDIKPWPFPLSERFLDELGYAETVAGFNSPAMRAHLAAVLADAGVSLEQAPPVGTRRFVMLYWEPGGDELGWSDGVHGGAGQLRDWAWLEYMHGRTPLVSVAALFGWRQNQDVFFGSSDEPARHALVVDALEGYAFVVPMDLAYRVVRQESLDPE
jgi:hypothetical protein